MIILSICFTVAIIIIIYLIWASSKLESFLKKKDDYIKLQASYIQELGNLICDQHKEINGSGNWGDLLIKLSSIREKHGQ